MKKICFITTVHGTLRSFVLVTAEYLYKTGKYDITFISHDNEEFRNSLPPYIKFEPVNMKRGLDLSFPCHIFKLYKLFKKNNFDMVQYATPNASLYSSIASKLARVKIRIYGQWGLRYLTMSGLKRKIYKNIEKFTCALSTHIHVTSYKNRKFGIKENFYDEGKSFLFGDGGATGLDLKQYDIVNKNKYYKEINELLNLNNEIIFGFVGRFTVDKGANELIEAFKRVTEKTNSKLLIIGDIENQEKINKDLLKWAIESEQVIFTGRLTNKVLKKYYSRIDVYVHPSYREGYSKVIQEAAAMGCAIITTDIPGASEVMVNRESCVLVDKKNVEQLYNSMLELSNNFEKRIELGRKARLRIEKNFDRTIKLKEQQEVYENILWNIKLTK